MTPLGLGNDGLGSLRWPAQSFYDVVGDLSPVTAMQAFVTRQALVRAWGQFQQRHPLIVAPVCADVPFKVGTDLDSGHVAEDAVGPITPINPR